MLKAFSYCKQRMESALSLPSGCVKTKLCQPCTSFTSHLYSLCGMVWHRTLIKSQHTCDRQTDTDILVHPTEQTRRSKRKLLHAQHVFLTINSKRTLNCRVHFFRSLCSYMVRVGNSEYVGVSTTVLLTCISFALLCSWPVYRSHYCAPDLYSARAFCVCTSGEGHSSVWCTFAPRRRKLTMIMLMPLVWPIPLALRV